MNLFSNNNSNNTNKDNTNKQLQSIDNTDIIETIYQDALALNSTTNFDPTIFKSIVNKLSSSSKDIDKIAKSEGITSQQYYLWIFRDQRLLEIHMRAVSNRQVVRFGHRSTRMAELETYVKDKEEHYRDRDLRIRLEQVMLKNDELLLKKGNPEVFGDKQQVDVNVNDPARLREQAWNARIQDSQVTDAECEDVQGDENQ